MSVGDEFLSKNPRYHPRLRADFEALRFLRLTVRHRRPYLTYKSRSVCPRKPIQRHIATAISPHAILCTQGKASTLLPHRFYYLLHYTTLRVRLSTLFFKFVRESSKNRYSAHYLLITRHTVIKTE